MGTPKSVVDLLAAQPEEVLREMEDGLRTEIARLQGELGLIEAAVNRTASRRRPPRTPATTGETGRSSGGGGVKRADLFHIIAEQGKPVAPAEMGLILRAKGFDMATSAVRTAMSRLVADGKLIRQGEGLYTVNYGNNGSHDPHKE